VQMNELLNQRKLSQTNYFTLIRAKQNDAWEVLKLKTSREKIRSNCLNLACVIQIFFWRKNHLIIHGIK